MISSQGSQQSDFGVLNSQTSGKDDAVHVIKINKKIGDSKFSKIPQPTEILLKSDIKIETTHEDQREADQGVGFVTPRVLVDYLDFLIIKKKLPLRTLKFDIEFSKSRDEVVRRLEKHAKEIGNIEKVDLDKLFAFIDANRELGSLVKSDSENLKNILDTEDSEGSDKPESDTQPDLSSSRSVFARLLVLERQKARKDREVFKMLVSDLANDLGVKKEMPAKPESLELIDARKDYHEARKHSFRGITGCFEEAEVFNQEQTNNLPPKTQGILRKSLSLLDSFDKSTEFSEALMSADLRGVNNIIQSNTFSGMRIDAPSTEVLHNNVIEKAEKIHAVLMPSSSLIIKNSPEEDVKNHSVSSGTTTSDAETPVQVEVMEALNNFVPKNDELVVEKSPEESQSGNVAKNAPVDSTIAEEPQNPQNVFPTEYEGKSLEVQHGFPGKPNEIRVFYDNKEIAVGEVTRDGGKIKVKKEFKSGFLLADTIEERALKHARTIIKTLKPA